MTKSPEFSQQQKIVIRERLLRYRATALPDRKQLSLRYLIDQIEAHEPSWEWLFRGEESQLQIGEHFESTLTENVVRKWLLGELVHRGRGAARQKIRHYTTPSDDIYMAVFLFLKDKKYLDNQAMQEGSDNCLTLAYEFLQFLQPSQRPMSDSPSHPDISGEYHSINLRRDFVEVHRYTFSKHREHHIYNARKRTSNFKKTSTPPFHVNFDAPESIVEFIGWIVVSEKYSRLHLKNEDPFADELLEYKLGNLQEVSTKKTLTLVPIIERGPNFFSAGNITITNSYDIFIDNMRDLMNNTGHSIYSTKIKLLRKPNFEVKNRSVFDYLEGILSQNLIAFERFVLSGGDINAHHPETGDTILHIAAKRLDRAVLKILIKRLDLDYLAENHFGEYPSHAAFKTDPASSIAQFLAVKEKQAAQETGIDYQARIVEMLGQEENRIRLEREQYLSTLGSLTGLTSE